MTYSSQHQRYIKAQVSKLPTPHITFKEFTFLQISSTQFLYYSSTFRADLKRRVSSTAHKRVALLATQPHAKQ